MQTVSQCIQGENLIRRKERDIRHRQCRSCRRKTALTLFGKVTTIHSCVYVIEISSDRANRKEPTIFIAKPLDSGILVAVSVELRTQTSHGLLSDALIIEAQGVEVLGFPIRTKTRMRSEMGLATMS